MRPLLLVVAVIALAANAFGSDASPTDDTVGTLVIVVDAGHGGANSGAPSVHDSLSEKHFTLAVSKRLAAELKARGARVVMTRTSDEYLTLRQRSAIANDVDADLFLSIHGNASPDRSHRGFETYFLSPSALDVDGRALRTIGARRAGMPRAISRLVDDVERGFAHPKSAELATAIQTQLAKVRTKSPNRGVKQESMHVLLGANMPAVLIELGFIDHPVEGLELQDSAVQLELVSAIADAIVPR